MWITANFGSYDCLSKMSCADQLVRVDVRGGFDDKEILSVSPHNRRGNHIVLSVQEKPRNLGKMDTPVSRSADRIWWTRERKKIIILWFGKILLSPFWLHSWHLDFITNISIIQVRGRGVNLTVKWHRLKVPFISFTTCGYSSVT